MVISTATAITGFGAIIFISLLSFAGALTLASKGKRLPLIYEILITFATGALIGTVLYHLLPESVEIHEGFTNQLATLVGIGILIPFLLEKVVHWHHHHALEHHHLNDEQKEVSDEKIKPYVYVNLLGDGLHNFVDGAIIIATFSVSTTLGVVTLIGIAIHELAQELGEFSILIQGGLEVRKALFWNFLSALTAILGGLVALLMEVELLEKIILPVAAGNFLYLAIADLIPELHQKVHKNDWIVQVGMGGVGILLMFLLTFLE